MNKRKLLVHKNSFKTKKVKYQNFHDFSKNGNLKILFKSKRKSHLFNFFKNEEQKLVIPEDINRLINNVEEDFDTDDETLNKNVKRIHRFIRRNPFDLSDLIN